jgi:hypothetical protein
VLYKPQPLPANDSGLPFVFSLYNQNDPLYVASAKFSNQTSLPTWTSSNYYFLPMGMNKSLFEDPSQRYRTRSTGYGADLECQQLLAYPSDSMYAFNFSSGAAEALFIISHRRFDGSITHCKPFLHNHNPWRDCKRIALHSSQFWIARCLMTRVV